MYKVRYCATNILTIFHQSGSLPHPPNPSFALQDGSCLASSVWVCSVSSGADYGCMLTANDASAFGQDLMTKRMLM
jgi:hypothetical protein